MSQKAELIKTIFPLSLPKLAYTIEISDSELDLMAITLGIKEAWRQNEEKIIDAWEAYSAEQIEKIKKHICKKLELKSESVKLNLIRRISDE